jgi:hypothetical protein
MKPGIATRFALFAARKSRRLEMVVRLTAFCGRVRGVLAELRGLQPSPTADGSRDGGHEQGCSAEMCASSLMILCI